MDEYADVRKLWEGKYRVIAIDFLGLGPKANQFRSP